ncbi:hypothetical protein A9K58_06495 [Stenotrophomonas maltophilia]|uniref:Transmembrane protein n=1 Tax=Stenotrophomonas maltophilia TaxID=40324 RepID=A0A1A6XZR8_STEMA|nr:hypothetical protein [Stenotrophomonas maltophilia]OBU68458.1 hypothetical protein A9K58_06495 [Stenotrophomonas maltophilia]
MERERPDYLQPIPRSRWEFPWLGLWAVLLLGMAAAGIWLHLQTGNAWNERFQKQDASPKPVQHAAPSQPTTAGNDRFMAEIRARRELAEAEAKMAEARLREVAAERAAAGRSTSAKKDEYRCINGIAFRRIPGGWENVPGDTCQ